jgi:hypothetical protein
MTVARRKLTTARANAPVPKSHATGLIPRNYSTHPVGCYAFAPEFPESELVPESEWADRLAENRKNKSGLLDLRIDHYDILKSLDQDGLGLCWAFSSTKACMYTRALAGEPPLRLSAWYVAGKIKGWRDEGGWGAASLEFIAQNGVPVLDLCPKYSHSYDTEAAAANGAFHKFSEWWDGSDNPSVAQKQLVSMLLKRRPCVVDLNDMGHSMCAIDIDSLNPLRIVYDNSWGEQGDRGLYVGQGARARPDGLVVPRVVTPSQT